MRRHRIAHHADLEDAGCHSQPAKAAALMPPRTRVRRSAGHGEIARRILLRRGRSPRPARRTNRGSASVLRQGQLGTGYAAASRRILVSASRTEVGRRPGRAESQTAIGRTGETWAGGPGGSQRRNGTPRRRSAPATVRGGRSAHDVRARYGNAVKDFRSRIRENSEVLGRLRILTNSATIVFPVFSTPRDPSRRCRYGIVR